VSEKSEVKDAERERMGVMRGVRVVMNVRGEMRVRGVRVRGEMRDVRGEMKVRGVLYL
jgi:hypothetical protein